MYTVSVEDRNRKETKDRERKDRDSGTSRRKRVLRRKKEQVPSRWEQEGAPDKHQKGATDNRGSATGTDQEPQERGIGKPSEVDDEAARRREQGKECRG